MSEVTCISPCKLNLFLYITGRRPDGYHELETLFALLDYGDTMSFKPNLEGKFSLEGPFNFPFEQNLIYKAYKLLLDTLPQSQAQNLGVSIKVLKKIPEGGGLGGGSSNTATTLLVLNKLFKASLSIDELAALGLKLGADVPVFIRGHNAFATGVGEKLQSVELKEQYALVVTPFVEVNTKKAFSDPDLKRDSPKRALSELLKLPLHNDFTKTVIKSAPQVGLALDRLLKYGPAQMSGSGSSCFVLFDSYELAYKAFSKLDVEEFRSCFIAKIVNHSPVLDAIDAL